MAKPPQVRAERLVRALEKIGFSIRRQSGSHAILAHDDGRFANVPIHGGRDVPSGVLGNILQRVGITADELKELL